MIETFIEIKLKQPEDFLKVRETLTRIGVASKKEDKNDPRPKLYQSCHILHKRGQFYIVHFKSMFALDGKESTLSEDDVARTNRIAKLLEQWGLVELVDPSKSDSPLAPINQIKIISHKEKDNWQLIPKYTIGRKTQAP